MQRVVHEINPRYDDQVKRGRLTRLPAAEQAALEEFLESPEWNTMLLLLLARRGGGGVAPTEPGKISVALTKADHFKRGFQEVILAMSIVVLGQA